MKPKLVLTILSLAAIVVGSAFLLSFLMSPGAGKLPSALDARSATPSNARNENQTTEPAPKLEPPLAASTNATGSVQTANTNTFNPAELTGDAREEYIQQRLDELSDLSGNRDVVSRDKILAELQNPLKEVREAALQAAIDFNDRSVVPRLREVAELSQDPREKAQILEAIDYINLPSLTERLAQAGKQ